MSRPKEEGGIAKEFESGCGSEGVSEEGEDLESLPIKVLEENQSDKKSEMEMGSPMEGGQRTDETEIDGDCDQMDQNSICENNEFSFDDILFQKPRLEE